MKKSKLLPFAISFTGTQAGCTGEQRNSLYLFLNKIAKETVTLIGVHGDCIGADHTFDSIIRTVLSFDHMVIRPCNLAGKRAFCPPGRLDVVHAEMGPLQRNELIVADGDALVACPKEDHMTLRSGTWTTVRYAMRAAKPVTVILPNGAIIPWSA